jgi:hypothetical protein
MRHAELGGEGPSTSTIAGDRAGGSVRRFLVPVDAGGLSAAALALAIRLCSDTGARCAWCTSGSSIRRSGAAAASTRRPARLRQKCWITPSAAAGDPLSSSHRSARPAMTGPATLSSSEVRSHASS